MASTASQRRNWSSRFLANVRQLQHVLKELRENSDEWDDLTMTADLVQSDFEEGTGLEHLTPQSLTDAITSTRAIDDFTTDQFHRGNLNRILP